MAYIFQSIFASEFKNFLIMIRDAGQQTRGYEATFKSLDIFISENPVQGESIDRGDCQQMAGFPVLQAPVKEPADNPCPGILQIPERIGNPGF